MWSSLRTADMCMLEPGRVFMNVACGWAFAKPIRKVFYKHVHQPHCCLPSR